MPHAKIDVAFIRDHFARVPEKDRPRAIALYLELVLTSAEMLLDGLVPQHVALVCAHKIGISRSRYGRSEVSKLVHSLAAAELAEVLQNGDLQLRYWADHHNSRGYVDDRRKLDADRKREKRGQTTIPGMGTNVRSGHEPDDAADVHADLARGGARTRSASASEKNSSSSAPRPATADDDDLSLRLEHLGVNDRALIAAAATDPDRAAAWIDHATQHADRNAAGYFRTNFTTGAWPPNGNGKPHTDPDERRERFLVTNGYLLPDDELEYQLRTTYAATDDDVVTALERAHDLRHASVST